MLSSYKITEIFCSIDDFCQDFLPVCQNGLLSSQKRIRPSRLHLSEIMTIQVLFHFSGYRNFKTFYKGYVAHHLRSYFPDLVSYNRMVELKRDSLLPLAIYLKSMATGDCTGISFIDSTPLRVCHNKRIHNHKVFDGLAWPPGGIVPSDGSTVSNFILSPLRLVKSLILCLLREMWMTVNL